MDHSGPKRTWAIDGDGDGGRGTLSVQAIHGVAVFNGLTLNKPAVGYMIKATVSGLTLATSSIATTNA